MSLEIIMYHYVRPISSSSYPRIKGLEVEGFVRQIKYLRKNKNIVSTSDVVRAVSGKIALPDNSVWLTFDDGYKDHYEYVAPILEKFGFDAVFFPVSDTYTSNKLLDVNAIHYILASINREEDLISLLRDEMSGEGYSYKEFESLWDSVNKSSRYDSENVMFFKKVLQRELPIGVRHRVLENIFGTVVGKTQSNLSKELYMSESEILSLADRGFTIGSHTASHKWLNHLSRDEQKNEIDKSLDALSKIRGTLDNWTMCYPYGGYNEDTLDLLKDANCALAVTTRVGAVNISTEHKYRLPRLDTNDFPQ